MSFPWVDTAEGVDADVLRVGLGDIHRQREDERGRVDRGGHCRSRGAYRELVWTC